MTSTQTHVDPMKFGVAYVKSLSGRLKLLEVVFSCIGLSLISFTSYHTFPLFISVAAAAVCWNSILLIFYILHVIQISNKIPWLKFEVVSCVAFSVLYFSTVFVAVQMLIEKFSIFFFLIMLIAFGLMFVFGYDALLKLRSLQSAGNPQSVGVVSQVTDVEQPSPKL